MMTDAAMTLAVRPKYYRLRVESDSGGMCSWKRSVKPDTRRAGAWLEIGSMLNEDVDEAIAR